MKKSYRADPASDDATAKIDEDHEDQRRDAVGHIQPVSLRARRLRHLQGIGAEKGAQSAMDAERQGRERHQTQKARDPRDHQRVTLAYRTDHVVLTMRREVVAQGARDDPAV